jgi:solute carrier family 35 protein E3
MSSRSGFGKHIPSADVPAASSIHADDAKLHDRGGSRGAAFVFPGRRAFGGKSASPMEIGTVGALALSVSSSVSIVIVNKYLISTLGFPYVTCLTATHMAVTAVALRVAARVKLLEPKGIEKRALAKFAALNGVSVAFLNLSLGFNSVGFYQMTKLAIIPCTVSIQQAFYGKSFSNEVKAALATLLLGVAVATVTDARVNFLGTTVSLLAVATTCVSQIWTNTMQKEHGVNSTQLLYAASPYMAAILAAVALPLDVGLTSASSGSAPNVFSNDGGSTGAIVFVASLTCVIAVLVNFSTFLVIGKCDAVTYQVLGHLKTVLVLAFGFFALGDPMSFKNVLGIGVALLGMVAYGAAETAEKRRASSTDSSSGVGGVESLKGSLLPTTTKG